VLNYLMIDPKLSSNMKDNIGHPSAPPRHLLAPGTDRVTGEPLHPRRVACLASAITSA
jgi:hypothetical protein